MKKILSLTALCLLVAGWAIAQDSTAAAEVKEAPKKKFTRTTFNSTRIINLQSTEIGSKGGLEFMVSHHFSNLWNKDAGSQNVAQFFGINSGVARTYLSFAYSFTNQLSAGIALAGSSKYEGWIKAKLLRQSSGPHSFPVTVTWFSLAHVNTATDPDNEFTYNRFAFANQLLIARKLSDRFSLELIPTWVHYNVVPYGINNSNEVFSLGIGGKYKVKSKLNLTFEYTRQLNMYENLISKSGTIVNYHPDLASVGIEVNTGGHLFQFYIGSTQESSIIDQLTRNNSSIKSGNLAFGFTINRSLSFNK